MNSKEVKKARGVFERPPGFGIWWIQYFDSDGRRRREKAGTRDNAKKLVEKRRTERLTAKKLPEKLRARVVRFNELAEDAKSYSKEHNRGSAVRSIPHRTAERRVRQSASDDSD
jgi:hypothetical protein